MTTDIQRWQVVLTVAFFAVVTLVLLVMVATGTW
jgi:hypothetical protein